MNISYNVRYTDFVQGIFRKKFTKEWLEVVFTDRSHQTILWRNVMPELGGICVDVSQKSCVNTIGYMK